MIASKPCPALIDLLWLIETWRPWMPKLGDFEVHSFPLALAVEHRRCYEHSLRQRSTQWASELAMIGVSLKVLDQKDELELRDVGRGCVPVMDGIVSLVVSLELLQVLAIEDPIQWGCGSLLGGPYDELVESISNPLRRP